MRHLVTFVAPPCRDFQSHIIIMLDAARMHLGATKSSCSARDKYHRITRAKSPVRLKCLLSFLRLMPHSFRRRCRARGDILSFGPMCDKATSSEKNLFEVDARSYQSLLMAERTCKDCSKYKNYIVSVDPHSVLIEIIRLILSFC